MRVIGTAGHVDHGKSTLIRALTGIDPDRLAEEKERSMTIDLGFAWLELPSGQTASVVDVPGHEDFIKNMLAGVGGIDVALFTVAADEGVMPQTREHLAILDLLEVENCVIALTKQDLIEDPEWLLLVEEDIRDQFADTTLAEAPIIPVSAMTGEGLDTLLNELDRVIADSPVRRDIGKPRLPIDRAFILSGFGTIVTGTLTDGELYVGQEVEILPSGLESRIRGLQTHKQDLEAAVPGSRVAANLSGVSTDELSRGDVVSAVGVLQATSLLDVQLRLLSSAPKALEHNDHVDFYIGASVVDTRIRLLGRDALEPGRWGWAQFVPSSPVVALKGDRFIIRQPSPSLTIGGGQVMDPTPLRRHRRFELDTISHLETLAEGTPEEIMWQRLSQLQPKTASQMITLTQLMPQVGEATLHELLTRDEIIVLGDDDLSPEEIIRQEKLLFTRAGWTHMLDRVETLLGAYHRRNPLRLGMPRTELASRLHLDIAVFNPIVAQAIREGHIAETSTGSLRLPEYEIQLSETQQKRVNTLLEAFHAEPYTPPSTATAEEVVGPELLASLLEQRVLIQVSPDVLFSAETYDEMVDEIQRYLKEHETVTLAQVRDLFDTSRKYATALLEHLDERRITRRVGDERILRTT